MHLHQYITKRCEELGINWDSSNSRFNFVVSSVLDYFEVNVESDIDSDKEKLEIAEIILNEAISQDLKPHRIKGTKSKFDQDTQPLRERTNFNKERVRKLYDWMPVEELDEEESAEKQRITHDAIQHRL